ncbi:MAG: redoxin domain-containing protein [Acidobacteria bacterium]|nr:redoxin domain-containing protein [Acidobacteriota bacterium]
MKRLAVLLLAGLALLAQEPPSEAEEEHLRQVVGEAGSSPIEFMRAVETHLKKYPNSARRADLERALVTAAMDARDNRRIRLYGEKVLERETDDPQILERVARALLVSDDKESSERALKYAQALERTGRLIGKALVYQARATGNLGKLDEAAALARRSYEASPNAESAREIARWLARQDKNDEAVRHLADAFAFPDPAVTDAERAADRARLGEIWRKSHDSESGLGDAILAAYDRVLALAAARRAKALEIDPNSQAALPMEFTLPALEGPPLKMASLQGKVIVVDFWATWCGPCRAQKPLYDQVKKRFRDEPRVVFLAVSTDEDRTLVEPFLKQNQWPRQVYFEDGLARLLRISSIPTTLILGKTGEVFSRLNGYVPDRFVDMLTERVKEALAE